MPFTDSGFRAAVLCIHDLRAVVTAVGYRARKSLTKAGDLVARLTANLVCYVFLSSRLAYLALSPYPVRLTFSLGFLAPEKRIEKLNGTFLSSAGKTQAGPNQQSKKIGHDRRRMRGRDEAMALRRGGWRRD